MGELIGAMGSVGILALIGLLILSFFLQIGTLKKENFQSVLWVCLWTACAGAGYLLLMLLCRQTVYGNASLDAFRDMGNGYLRAALDGLAAPGFKLPVTGLMSYAGHGLGTILLGQYRLAGFLLSFLCTAGAAILFRKRLKTVFGDQAADDGCFLLLCDPCAVFFFFPCAAPLALLAVCAVFFLAAKRVKPRRLHYSRALFCWAAAVSACLSAAVACAIALGRIG